MMLLNKVAMELTQEKKRIKKNSIELNAQKRYDACCHVIFMRKYLSGVITLIMHYIDVIIAN